jgi:hypothetical protein
MVLAQSAVGVTGVKPKKGGEISSRTKPVR